MFRLKSFFCLLYLILIIKFIKSQTICLNNSFIICYCKDDSSPVTCIENSPSDDTFIDWSTFSSEHEHYSFHFINFTRLTSSTFTNFSSKFPLIPQIRLDFINGIDEITENIFESFNYFINTPIYLRFNSPRNFQLADNAFSQMKYLEFDIDDIQFTNIHNLPYEFNLKAFDHTNIFQINILNSKEMHFISNQSSTLLWQEIQISNCSLTNVDLLFESLSSQSLIKLDLSSNELIHIPPLMKFSEIINIDLHNNFIEEIKSHIFTNSTHLFELDLSFNRIKHISFDAFLGLQIGILLLHDNHLNSLETVTIHNELTSFLYPINQTLIILDLSNNFLHNFDPIRNLSNLNALQLSFNQIKHLEEDSFRNTYQLRRIELNSNHIESIHPLTFNRTIVTDLDLSSNLFTSLETTKIKYDEDFKPRNVTTSFLDNIASTLITLSLVNCTHLEEINWFIFTKLKSLSHLNLSQIPKTNKFWFYESRNNTLIQSNYRSLFLQIVLNDIHFNNDDYCLSKSIFHILNPTSLILDKNHPCNCFVFMFKNILDTNNYPICLSNHSIVDDLTQQCMNIDLYCSSLSNSTTITSTQSTSSLSTITNPLTESSSSSSSTTVTSTQSSLSSTSVSTKNSTISTTTTTTTKTDQPLTSNLTTLITTTNIPTTLGAVKDDRKWKTILAIMIPLTVIIIALSVTAIYIVKKQKAKKSKEAIEMQGGFENIFARK